MTKHFDRAMWMRDNFGGNGLTAVQQTIRAAQRLHDWDKEDAKSAAETAPAGVNEELDGDDCP